MTACAAYRASDEKRVLPTQRCLPGPGQLRLPGSAGGQERYRKFSARTLPSNPLHNRTRNRSFCRSFVPSVRTMGNVYRREHTQFFCLSQEVCFLICHMLSCGSTVIHADLGVRIIAAARRPCHLARHTGVPFRFSTSQRTNCWPLSCP